MGGLGYRPGGLWAPGFRRKGGGQVQYGYKEKFRFMRVLTAVTADGTYEVKQFDGQGFMASLKLFVYFWVSFHGALRRKKAKRTRARVGLQVAFSAQRTRAQPIRATRPVKTAARGGEPAAQGFPAESAGSLDGVPVAPGPDDGAPPAVGVAAPPPAPVVAPSLAPLAVAAASSFATPAVRVTAAK